MPSTKSLRATTLSGVKWNFIGQAGRQSIGFLVSIVLARLLTPREFGLLAILFIFQEVANALVNSGLNAPLVQNQEISEQDCSTVFYFNIVVALFCYLSLVVSAPYIALFYREPDLNNLVMYYGLVFLIHSFGNVQLGLLVRQLNYRQMNLVELIGLSAAGLVAVFMATRGYGVYSLLGQQISYAVITTALYWLKSSWRPAAAFSWASFRALFGFGSKILVVSILDKTLNTFDNLVVGRFQGTAFVGQYSRGKTTRDLPMNYITGVITSLVFPVFSRISGAKDLTDALSRFIGVVSYMSAPVMVGMALVADPLIVVLYSATWRPAAPFLRLFCLFGITVPLNSVLVQTVMSRGAAGSLLGLEMRKKALLMVALGVGAFLGPVGLVSALCIGHYLMLWLSLRSVARLLGTSTRRIVSDAWPGVGLSLLMGIPVYVVGQLSWRSPLWQLVGSVGVGVVSYWALSALFGSRDYVFTKGLVMERLFPAGRKDK